MSIRRLLLIFAAAVFAASADPAAAHGQVIVDRTIATVSDGVKTELITRSDLMWQLALQTDVPLQPPSQDDLRRALQLQIDQRIFALEAQRLPRPVPDEKEISDYIGELLKKFPFPGEFQRRLRAVGFDSVKDVDFEAIIVQRMAIEKYIDFRFRSFVVITAEEESKYFQDDWLPRFKRRNPLKSVPTLDEVRAEVNRDLTEERVLRNMEVFIEEAKRRVTITIVHEI